MRLSSVGPVIATRKLTLSGTTTVSVVIGKPKRFPDGNGCYCPYQILGLDSERVSFAGGGDSVQALMLTFQAIGSVLYTSQAAREGLLTWNSSRRLGFPVPDSLRDLLPP